MEEITNAEVYLSCKFCGKGCKNGNSLRNHERLCKCNPNRQASSFVKYNKSEEKRQAGQNVKKGLRECQFCKKVWETTKTGWHTHELHCVANPNRKAGSFKGKKHTEEQKRKISEGAKRVHGEGRGHTWKNRYLNPSYAEQWLYGFLDARNVQYKKEVPFKGFFLDVVVGNKVIEIDGEQHYLPEQFPEQIERDQRKDKLLKEEGYQELRLRWSLIQKDKENQIKILENFLNN